VPSPYGGVKPPPLGVTPPPLGVVPPPRGLPPHQSSGSRLPPPPPVGVAPSWQSVTPTNAQKTKIKPAPTPTNASVKLSLGKSSSGGGTGGGGARIGGSGGSVVKKPRLAQVFNADDSSDEEEIPPEARYKHILIFYYSHPCPPCIRVLHPTELSSWEDFVLQNENEKRRSGDRHLQRTKQLWEDPAGIYRHKQIIRKAIARGHGCGVQRQQGQAQGEQVNPIICPFNKFSNIFNLSLIVFNILVFRYKMSDLKDDTNPDKLIEATENLEISEGGKKKKNKKKKKVTEPSENAENLEPLSSLFPSGNYPEGQIMEHPIAADDQKELV